MGPTAPLLLSCYFLCVVVAQSCKPLSLNTTVLGQTAPYFHSWNIDSSRDRVFFDTDFSNPKLTYLASQIPNAHIRFGGTGNDALYYLVPGAGTSCTGGECLNTSWILDLWELSRVSNSPIVFGVNIHPPGGSSPPKGPWDSTNARALFAYLKSQNLTVFGVEIGNEQNTIMSAEDQAGALLSLSSLLDSVYGPSSSVRPVLIGPDPHSFRDAGSSMAQQLAFIKTFVTTLGKTPLRAVTHHEYIEIDYKNVLDPKFLDTTANIAVQVMEAVRSVNSNVEVWAGERFVCFKGATLIFCLSFSLSNTHTLSHTHLHLQGKWGLITVGQCPSQTVPRTKSVVVLAQRYGTQIQ